MENSFSLLSLFSGRDLMTLSVSLILVTASIMSWAEIIEKIRLWNFQKSLVCLELCGVLWILFRRLGLINRSVLVLSHQDWLWRLGRLHWG